MDDDDQKTPRKPVDRFPPRRPCIYPDLPEYKKTLESSPGDWDPFEVTVNAKKTPRKKVDRFPPARLDVFPEPEQYVDRIEGDWVGEAVADPSTVKPAKAKGPPRTR